MVSYSHFLYARIQDAYKNLVLSKYSFEVPYYYINLKIVWVT